MKRPIKILLGLVVGTVLGMVCHVFFADSATLDFVIRNIAQPAGQVFLRLILMIVIPLIFSVLVLGVFELGDLRSLGRVGLKTLIYTVLASLASVLIGLGLVVWFRPGSALDQAVLEKIGIRSSEAARVIQDAAQARSLPDILVSLIPRNPLAAAVQAFDGEMIALMLFALLFGVALAIVRPGREDDPLLQALTTVRDVSMKIVDFAMALAPYGVAGLIFSITAKFGWEVLASLGKYVLIVIGGLLLQQFVVYGAVLKFYVRRSPLRFVAEIKEVIITAFSTASSNVTLPTTIRVSQDVLQIDRRIASFVLTIGSTANQNGTALFEGVTILFLAQVFNVDLSLGQQLTVLFMSVAAGIGTAGIPGGSIPLIVVVMQSVGIPAEGIGIILGVDRLLDMCRTVVNVTGDIVAACVIAESERRALAANSPAKRS